MSVLHAGPGHAPGGTALTSSVLAAVLLGALAQSVSGLGFSLVSAPFLVVLLGPLEGVRIGVALSIVLNVALLVRLRRDVDRRSAVRLLVPSVLATPVVVRLARAVPERPAAGLAGALVLLGALLLVSGVRWPAAAGRVGMVAASLLAATSNVVAGVAGPPVALWAENAGWDGARQRATLQAYFLGANLVAIAFLGLPAVGPGLLLSCVAALAVGALLGIPLASRTSDATARRATLGLAAVGGAAALLSAVAG